MKVFQPLLLELLRLDAGLLDSRGAQRLNSIIRSDRNVNEKWNALKAAIANRWHENESGSQINGVPVISSRWMAAFLENRLDPKRIERIESACWEHPQLLQTVVELFQLEQASVENVSIDATLTERLLGMVGAPVPETPVDASVVAPQILVQPEPGIAESWRVKPSSRRWSPVLWCVAASIAGLAVIGTAWWTLNRPINTPAILAGTNADSAIAVDSQPDTLPDNPVEPESVDRPVPDSNDQQLVENPAAPEQFPIPEMPPRKPEALPNKTANSPTNSDKVARNDPIRNLDNPSPWESPTALSLQWHDIQGLIAVRNSENEKWVGVEHDAFVPQDGFTTLVLPGSLGQLRMDSIGTMDLAPNTRATWHVDSVNGIIKVELEQGGVMLGGAPAGTVLKVDDGLKQWSIAITGQDTVVGIDGETAMDEPGSRLFVKDGSVVVEGTEIKQKHQMVWISEIRHGVSRFANLPDWTRGKNSGSFKIPKTLTESLARSDDMARDFLSVLDGNDVENHDVARFCLASIEPESFERAYLANVDPRVRQQGIVWLMQFQQSQRGIRKIAARIARIWHAPEIGRALPRIVYALQTNRAPTLGDAEQLVAGLSHDHQPVRQLSADLLVHIFGARIAYSADGTAAERERSAHAWLVLINELYGRSDHRRRGQ